MKKIDGTITFEDGETKSAPTAINPVGVFDKFELKVWIWDNGGYGQNYSAGISLSDFTDAIPKSGDKFTFKLSGESSVVTTKFSSVAVVPGGIGFECYDSNWGNYQWLGGTDEFKLSDLKKGIERTVNINTDPNANTSIYIINIGFYLLNISSDGSYHFDTDKRFPEGTKIGEVVVTIKNFRISLVK